MIEINLFPNHLRKRKKSSFLPMKALRIPQEAVIGLLGGLVVLLVLIHVLFQGVIFIKFFQHAYWKNKLAGIEPEKKKVDVVLTELRLMRNKLNAVDKVTQGEHISWSQKLNAISDLIPRGVWLNKVSLDDKVFLIDGSAVSRNQDEIASVGTFVTNLKHSEGFMRGLENIEVGSIQRRKIKTVEIADFLITIKVK